MIYETTKKRLSTRMYSAKATEATLWATRLATPETTRATAVTAIEIGEYPSDFWYPVSARAARHVWMVHRESEPHLPPKPRGRLGKGTTATFESRTKRVPLHDRGLGCLA